jgi:hypothetical protein
MQNPSQGAEPTGALGGARERVYARKKHDRAAAARGSGANRESVKR